MMKIILEDLRNDISDIQEKLRFDIQRIKNGEVLHINQNYTILLKEITTFLSISTIISFLSKISIVFPPTYFSFSFLFHYLFVQTF